MGVLAERVREHDACGSAAARVSRRIFRMRRRGEQRCPCGIGCCGGIAVSRRLRDSRHRPPEDVGVFCLPTTDRRIGDGQVQEGVKPGILQRCIVTPRTRVTATVSAFIRAIPGIVFVRPIDQRGRDVVPQGTRAGRIPKPGEHRLVWSARDARRIYRCSWSR